jgi:hypothetical protein
MWHGGMLDTGLQRYTFVSREKLLIKGHIARRMTNVAIRPLAPDGAHLIETVAQGPT